MLLLLAGGAQALTWQRTLVNRGGATYVSLALDQQGQPHISRFDWFDQVLKYSRFDGQAWHTEVVDGDIPNAAGSSSALALDRQDRPHISYVYSPNDGIRQLRYARFDGSAWRIETVDARISAFTSIALDRQDRPHISYGSSLSQVIKYAHWDGMTWQFTTVEQGNVNGYTSLKLDCPGPPPYELQWGQAPALCPF